MRHDRRRDRDVRAPRNAPHRHIEAKDPAARPPADWSWTIAADPSTVSAFYAAVEGAQHNAAAASPAVQMRAEPGAAARAPDAVHAAAARGVGGAGQPLPFAERIQRAFGRHDVSDVRAHVGGATTEAARAIGARAYARGQAVAFAATPDLHTVAHEVAHVVQQRRGVSLAGGVGQAGDAYERHADRVADAVVRGDSAEPLLSAAPAGTSRGGVQREAEPASQPATGADERQDITCEKLIKVEGRKRLIGGHERTEIDIEFSVMRSDEADERPWVLMYAEGFMFGLDTRSGDQGVLKDAILARFNERANALLQRLESRSQAKRLSPEQMAEVMERIIDARASLRDAVLSRLPSLGTKDDELAHYAKLRGGNFKDGTVDTRDPSTLDTCIDEMKKEGGAPAKAGGGGTEGPRPPVQPSFEIMAEVRFALSSAALDGTARGVLDRLAAVLQKDPGIATVRLEGYACDLGADAFNLALSRRRAEAVRVYLTEHGVSPGRLEAEGRGEIPGSGNKNDGSEATRALHRKVFISSTRRGAKPSDPAGPGDHPAAPPSGRRA